MMADYLDEHDGELPHQWQEREPDKLNYGYAESVEAIEKLLNSKAVSGHVGGNAYCPAHKMSDEL